MNEEESVIRDMPPRWNDSQRLMHDGAHVEQVTELEQTLCAFHHYNFITHTGKLHIFINFTHVTWFFN